MAGGTKLKSHWTIKTMIVTRVSVGAQVNGHLCHQQILVCLSYTKLIYISSIHESNFAALASCRCSHTVCIVYIRRKGQAWEMNLVHTAPTEFSRTLCISMHMAILFAKNIDKPNEVFLYSY